ncbi:hypothetical protein D3C76_312210 [compost metagenome]
MRCEDSPQCLDTGLLAGFVQRHTHTHVVDQAQVEARGLGSRQYGADRLRGDDTDGIEEMLLLDLVPKPLQALHQDRGQPVHAPGDLFQALWAVIDGIHAGDVGQQHLRGADVAGGLLAADVLLASLHGQAQGRLAEAVDGHADQAARHVTLERIAGCKESCMGAAETQRHTEALGAAQHHVGAKFARRGQQGQGQQVGSHSHQGTGCMSALHQGAMVGDVAGAGRVMQQQAEVAVQAFALKLGLFTDHHLDTQGLGTGAQHVEGLRVAMARNEKRRGLVLGQALAEGHGFGGGRGFVEQGCVGDFHAGQVADQGLEIQQRFQAPLGNFRLVRRVGGVPGRVLQQVAQDRRRRVAREIALADVVAKQLVLRGNGLDRGQGLGLALPLGQFEHAGALDALGDDAVDQGLERVVAGQRQHGVDIALARADVAGDELVVSAQRDLCCGHVGGLGSGVFGQETVVTVLVHQAVEITHVGHANTEEPARLHGRGIDQFRVVGQVFVDRDHFAGQRHADIAGGLDRLQHRDFITLTVLAQLRQLHEHHIAQCFLGKRGDAHGQLAALFQAQPFVFRGKTQSAHGSSSCYQVGPGAGLIEQEQGWCQLLFIVIFQLLK